MINKSYNPIIKWVNNPNIAVRQKLHSAIDNYIKLLTLKLLS